VTGSRRRRALAPLVTAGVVAPPARALFAQLAMLLSDVVLVLLLRPHHQRGHPGVVRLSPTRPRR
jgi:hypothetical protein